LNLVAGAAAAWLAVAVRGEMVRVSVRVQAGEATPQPVSAAEASASGRRSLMERGYVWGGDGVKRIWLWWASWTWPMLLLISRHIKSQDATMVINEMKHHRLTSA
jgi:hypothetical protein